jgi:hypothetical protein
VDLRAKEEVKDPSRQRYTHRRIGQARPLAAFAGESWVKKGRGFASFTVYYLL